MNADGWTVVTYKKHKKYKNKIAEDLYIPKPHENEKSDISMDEKFPEPAHYKCKQYVY